MWRVHFKCVVIVLFISLNPFIFRLTFFAVKLILYCVVFSVYLFRVFVFECFSVLGARENCFRWIWRYIHFYFYYIIIIINFQDVVFIAPLLPSVGY